MGLLRPLFILGLLLAAQEKPSLDKQVDDLVELLKDLSPDATREQFLGRPALSKLMALGPQAFPRLKHHFLEQQDWRLQASVGYLAVLHGRSDPQVIARCSALRKDPSLFVRMLMISISRDSVGGSCGVSVMPAMTSEEKAVYERLNLSHFDLSWMSIKDLESLTTQSLAIVTAGKLLVDPPQLNMLGGGQPDPNPKRLRSSGVRLLTPIARDAEHSLFQVLKTCMAHKASQLILDAAEE